MRRFSGGFSRLQQSAGPYIPKVIGDIPSPIVNKCSDLITKEEASNTFQVNLHNKTPFELFKHKKTLSVTDLSLPYCELQSLYQKCLGDDLSTPAMAAGTKVHEKLELKAAENLVGEVVNIPAEFVKTREDVWATKVLSQISAQATLLAGFEVRELYMFGMLGGYPVTGYIDSIIFRDGQMVIQETKTRSSPTLPFRDSQLISAYHQVLIYHELLQKWIESPQVLNKEFYTTVGLDIEKPFSDDLRHLIGGRDLTELHQQFDGSWPLLSDKLLVTYLHSANGKTIGTMEYDFDEEISRQAREYTLGFWTGQRPAFGVDPSEISKCKRCPYVQNCSWYEEMELPPRIT